MHHDHATSKDANFSGVPHVAGRDLAETSFTPRSSTSQSSATNLAQIEDVLDNVVDASLTPRKRVTKAVPAGSTTEDPFKSSTNLKETYPQLLEKYEDLSFNYSMLELERDNLSVNVRECHAAHHELGEDLANDIRRQRTLERLLGTARSKPVRLELSLASTLRQSRASARLSRPSASSSPEESLRLVIVPPSGWPREFAKWAPSKVISYKGNPTQRSRVGEGTARQTVPGGTHDRTILYKLTYGTPLQNDLTEVRSLLDQEVRKKYAEIMCDQTSLHCLNKPVRLIQTLFTEFQFERLFEPSPTPTGMAPRPLKTKYTVENDFAEPADASTAAPAAPVAAAAPIAVTVAPLKARHDILGDLQLGFSSASKKAPELGRALAGGLCPVLPMARDGEGRGCGGGAPIGISELEKSEEMCITIEDLEALRELDDEPEENHVETEKTHGGNRYEDVDQPPGSTLRLMPFSGLAFHPTQLLFAAALHNDSIQLCNYRMGMLVHRFEEPEGPARAALCWPAEATTTKSKVRDIRPESRRCLLTLHGHLDFVRTIQFHYEMPWIISCSDEGRIAVLRDLGLYPLACLMARTNDLEELAVEILQAAGMTETGVEDVPSDGRSTLKPAAGGWELEAQAEEGEVDKAQDEEQPGSTPGITQTEYWVCNSPLAREHVAAGSSETAMQLPNRQLGIVNFVFLAIYRSSHTYLTPVAFLPPLHLHIRRNPARIVAVASLPVVIRSLAKLDLPDEKASRLRLGWHYVVANRMRSVILSSASIHFQPCACTPTMPDSDVDMYNSDAKRQWPSRSGQDLPQVERIVEHAEDLSDPLGYIFKVRLEGDEELQWAGSPTFKGRNREMLEDYLITHNVDVDHFLLVNNVSDLPTTTELNGYYACTNCHTRSNNRNVVAAPMLEVLKWMEQQLEQKLVEPAQLLQKTRHELQHGVLHDYQGYYHWIALNASRDDRPDVFDCIPAPGSIEIKGKTYQLWDRGGFASDNAFVDGSIKLIDLHQPKHAERLWKIPQLDIGCVLAVLLYLMRRAEIVDLPYPPNSIHYKILSPTILICDLLQHATNKLDAEEGAMEAEALQAVEADALQAVEAEAMQAVEAEALQAVEAEALQAVELEALQAVEAEAAAVESLTIHKPVRDPNLKGKKRCPEPSTSDEDSESPGPSTKRPRTTSYSLRSSAKQSGSTSMPSKCHDHQKVRRPPRARQVASRGSSRTEDEDAEMLDVEEFNEQEEGGDNENEDEPDAGGRRESAGSGRPRRLSGDAHFRPLHSALDPTARLITPGELLSISTEDILAGLSKSSTAPRGDDNVEAQVDVLMAALPGVAHIVVYHGAIPVLCSKLIEISYIDLAEQTLSMMEKISEEFPSSIVRDNGLAALLNYLDFFSIAVQPTALRAVANCCRNISPKHASQIKEAWPIIRNCLGYSDQRFACLCVLRTTDSYHRTSIETLGVLIDIPSIRAVNQLLLPAGAPLVAANAYTSVAFPRITLTLLEAEIVDITYQILTGVLPPAGTIANEQGNARGGQGLGGGLADMTVMDNLVHRPKDQVEETLSLISELMPPLPKGSLDSALR
ncbi:Ubiquitin-protein ligase [Mycena chlorophos]|uniref:HECT-type E3 ubiquitin transferase n=1 Tax=Mycena chlorophos TaxID=658473 RepID=A0A8H6TAP8_MYCCL|nr:Ubiquitin-protein ligase [Mycena chlorophos]